MVVLLIVLLIVQNQKQEFPDNWTTNPEDFAPSNSPRSRFKGPQVETHSGGILSMELFALYYMYNSNSFLLYTERGKVCVVRRYRIDLHVQRFQVWKLAKSDWDTFITRCDIIAICVDVFKCMHNCNRLWKCDQLVAIDVEWKVLLIIKHQTILFVYNCYLLMDSISNCDSKANSFGSSTILFCLIHKFFSSAREAFVIARLQILKKSKGITCVYTFQWYDFARKRHKLIVIKSKRFKFV